MAVGKVQVLLPIALGEVVAAAADVVTNLAHDRLIDGGHLRGWQAVGPEQAIDGIGGEGGEEFAARIGPAVLNSAGYVERTRRAKCQKVDADLRATRLRHHYSV